ncbi:MAG TPA: cupin domain-containing protein [Balneolaceae bacterium]|nr:mannose-6-phosphate isomerase [Balneola sp.]HBQ59176.1 cupin domain-containing protein [Balneolaceae bacterium]|tara:strand:- start:15523 stop:15891 length:369 start_codon:yes stop_codon:yes gene_type:complete
MLKADLIEKFGLFDDYWTPRIIAELNDQFVKIAKLKGEFIWHNHENEDELFYIVKGSLLLKFRDRNNVKLNEGEMYVVPAGVNHLPVADEECWVMLIEPKSTEHTGSTITDQTVKVEDQKWI